MTWPLFAVALVLGIAALSDLLRLRIPNACTLALVLLLPAAGPPWTDHLLGGAAGLAFGLLGFAMGWFGGGDAKLLAGVALWCGVKRFPTLIMAVGLIGGGLAIVVLAARRCRLGHRLGLPTLEQDAPLPYGLAIAAGAWWVM